MSVAATSLLLDLDGTLIDSKPGIMESYRFAAQAVLPGVAFDPAAVAVGPPLPEMFRKSFPNATGAQQKSLTTAFRGHYAREGLFKSTLFDGVTEVLARCRQSGINLYIATNKPLHLSISILDHLKIAGFFRSVVAIDSVKPPFAGKAAMIRHLLNAHQVSASDAIYVGDTEGDAEAAEACGMRFIWAAFGYGKLSPHRLKSAFKTIQNFSDLGKIFE